MPDFTFDVIARMIDHSLLKQQMTDAELTEGCQLARSYNVASVCIKPYAVPLAARLLQGSTVAVGTTLRRRRSTAAVDRDVCTASSAAPSTTVIAMMSASVTWPTDAASALAASNISINGLISPRISSRSAVTRSGCASSFGPSLSMRARASADESPGAIGGGGGSVASQEVEEAKATRIRLLGSSEMSRDDAKDFSSPTDQRGRLDGAYIGG